MRDRALLEELRLSRRIFDSVSNGITISDAAKADLPLTYVNPAFERMTGYLAQEVRGRNCRFLQGNDHEQEGMTKLRKAIREEREERVLLKNYRKDGTLFWNELYMSPVRDADGRLTHFVGIQNDVTIQMESVRKLDHLAHHDALTGLANRGFLVAQLQQSLLRARRRGDTIAVLFFDLNNFKHVNDALGHDTGDELLKIVAERLKSETRAGEAVGRLGGDEFVVVLENFTDERRAPAVMNRLASKVSEPVDLLGQVFRPSASVGMAIFPQDGDTPETLLKAADFQMYIAKHNARETQPRKRSRGKS